MAERMDAKTARDICQHLSDELVRLVNENGGIANSEMIMLLAILCTGFIQAQDLDIDQFRADIDKCMKHQDEGNALAIKVGTSSVN